MAQITNESQKELRNRIELEFGALLEMLLNSAEPYKLCAELNKDVTEYMGNAQILTENKKELINLQ